MENQKGLDFTPTYVSRDTAHAQCNSANFINKYILGPLNIFGTVKGRNYIVMINTPSICYRMTNYP